MNRAAATAVLLPASGLALLGLNDALGAWSPVPSSALALVCGAAIALGLVLGLAAWLRAGDAAIRRRALVGFAINAGVLLLVGAAFLRGGQEREDRDAESERQHRLGKSALTGFGGWRGGLGASGVRLFAAQLDPQSELGRMIHGNFERPFTLLVLGVDNRAGAREVALDLSSLALVRADGSRTPALPRREILAGARLSRDEVVRRHAGPYRVAPGALLDQALAFLPPGEAMEGVVALEVVLDGEPRTIPGRWVPAGVPR